MLMSIVGNRPQFVKMAPIAHEIRARGLRDLIVHTGQHYDENMSDVFFREMDIPKPDISLTVEGRSHAQMTAEIMVKLEAVMLEHKPEAIVIYGDTNTTLAAAIVAVKLHIPIAHIEAGPRLYDLSSPEEVNRIFADHMARLRFCPDALSVEHLRKENITQGVTLAGDLMFDSFLHFLPRARKQSTVLKQFGLVGKPYTLLTAHRPNNTDSDTAIAGLLKLCESLKGDVLFAVHPRTKAAFIRAGLWETLNALPHVQLSQPLGYLDILAALDGCERVVTDSGGLQKEAFFAGKPGAVLFNSSPWPYLVTDGWLHCVGSLDDTAPESMLATIATMQPKPTRGDYFGDGRAAKKIVDALIAEGLLPETADQAMRRSASA
jgi:UDP-N-acetylglucosamine 2-epimerase